GTPVAMRSYRGGTAMSLDTRVRSSRRRIAIIGAAAALAVSAFPMVAPGSDTTPAAIRPFRAHIPQKAVDDLRRRIAATQWPERETVADQSQGVPLATMQELTRYWATDFDWRKAEAKLNAYPQFVMNIDGLDIHFIHVRSKHPNALPLLINHG